jgi:hypothetical protein
MKLAFTALVPHTLFDDPIDCLHRVVKPMMEAIRDQSRDQNLKCHQVRISIMVDSVDVMAVQGKDNLEAAVQAAILSGDVTDMTVN